MKEYELQTDATKMVTNESGAKRESKEGKGRYDLIPPDALRRLAIVYEKGAVLHGDRNWEKGLSISATINSAIRHCFKYLAGSSEEDHLAQAAWNLFAIMHLEKHKPKMQDIPTLGDNLLPDDMIITPFHDMEKMAKENRTMSYMEIIRRVSEKYGWKQEQDNDDPT